MNQQPTRRCFVGIEPNFQAIAMAWLNQPNQQAPIAPVQQQQQPGPSGSAASVAENQSLAQAQRAQRRASVASCRNIFSVDGAIEEVGFDHLSRVQHPNDDQGNASFFYYIFTIF